MALENASKLAGVLMRGGKEYVCMMRLHQDVEERELLRALDFFTGEIYQVPPIKSSVTRQPRIRTVYRIRFLEKQGKDVLFMIACSGGTYVRKYCHDVGAYIGCGAHMQELRRTRSGPFVEDDSVTLVDLYSATKSWKEEGSEDEIRRALKPAEEALELTGRIYVLDSAVDAVCHGASVAVNGISKLSEGISSGELVAVLTLKNEAVALAKALMKTEDVLRSDRGLAAKTERVLMKRGTYPAVWKHGRRSNTT